VRDLARGGDEAGLDEMIATLMSSVERADVIVRGLMASAASQKLQTQPGDVNELVTETWSLLEEEFASTSVTGGLELGGQLPEVAFDPAEMRHVLLNVLLNAAQAMGGSGKITVITRMETVRGIPPAEQATRSAVHLRNGSRAVVLAEAADRRAGGHRRNPWPEMFDPSPSPRAPRDPGTGLGIDRGPQDDGIARWCGCGLESDGSQRVAGELAFAGLPGWACYLTAESPSQVRRFLWRMVAAILVVHLVALVLDQTAFAGQQWVHETFMPRQRPPDRWLP